MEVALINQPKIENDLSLGNRCHICNKSFPKDEFDVHHANVHLVDTDKESKCITCELCGKTFDQKSNFTTHMRGVHHNEKPFGCKKCDKTFMFDSMVKRHVKFVHDNFSTKASKRVTQRF